MADTVKHTRKADVAGRRDYLVALAGNGTDIGDGLSLTAMNKLVNSASPPEEKAWGFHNTYLRWHFGADCWVLIAPQNAPGNPLRNIALHVEGKSNVISKVIVIYFIFFMNKISIINAHPGDEMKTENALLFEDMKSFMSHFHQLDTVSRSVFIASSIENRSKTLNGILELCSLRWHDEKAFYLALLQILEAHPQHVLALRALSWHFNRDEDFTSSRLYLERLLAAIPTLGGDAHRERLRLMLLERDHSSSDWNEITSQLGVRQIAIAPIPTR